MLHSVFIWQGYWQGGAARITLDIASYLQSHDINVTLGVFSKNPLCPLPQILAREPVWLPGLFRSLWASIIWRALYSRRFDAVYAHTLGLWKTRKNILFIHDALDLDRALETIPSVLHRLAYQIWRALYLWSCIRKADVVFCATQEFSDYVCRQGVSLQRIVKSGSWYDDKIFTPVIRGTPHPLFHVAWVGDSDDATKNFSLLKQQLLGSRDFVVHIAGGRFQDSRQNFIFHGTVPQKKVYEILSNSHVFVMTSRSEGFPIALLEAAATGIPCLVPAHALTHELKGIRSIATYEMMESLENKLAEIMRDFADYAVFDPRVTRFTHSNLVPHETKYIKKTLKSIAREVT